MKLEDHMGVGGKEKENKRNEVEGEGREEKGMKQDRGEREREKRRQTFLIVLSAYGKEREIGGTEEVVGVNSHCQMNCSTPASLPIYLRTFRSCPHEGFTQNNSITALLSNKKPLCCETRQPSPPLSALGRVSPLTSPHRVHQPQSDSVSYYHDQHCQH